MKILAFKESNHSKLQLKQANETSENVYYLVTDYDSNTPKSKIQFTGAFLSD